MEYFITIVGALGAWFLVAGPIYQAALELREEAVDQEGFEAAASNVPPSPKMSPWWWLLPPVAYIKLRRAGNIQRELIMASLTSAQREQAMTFLNKAHGWLLVALGAFLIAISATWEFTQLLHLGIVVFVVLVVAASILAVGTTVYQMSRSDRMLKDSANKDSANKETADKAELDSRLDDSERPAES